MEFSLKKSLKLIFRRVLRDRKREFFYEKTKETANDHKIYVLGKIEIQAKLKQGKINL